ncbi:MAG: hypothetical protein VB050_03265 [Geobacteraceae bacterium]|nr:hypothetical protein [Geobacteraceae bacterium]
MALIDDVRAKTKDTGQKLDDPGDYAAAVTEALKRYSKHRPRLICEDLAGNSTHDLAMPAGWTEGISAIVSVEYPVGTVPETLLESDDWAEYMTPAGKKIRLMHDAPSAAEHVRVLYQAVHTEVTLPATDLEAVANLGASICQRLLAALYAQTSDPTIGADVVNYRSKADEFRRLADANEAQYNGHLGIGKDTPAAAAMAVAKPTDNKRVRLTH